MRASTLIVGVLKIVGAAMIGVVGGLLLLAVAGMASPAEANQGIHRHNVTGGTLRMAPEHHAVRPGMPMQQRPSAQYRHQYIYGRVMGPIIIILPRRWLPRR